MTSRQAIHLVFQSGPEDGYHLAGDKAELIAFAHVHPRANFAKDLCHITIVK